MLPVLAAENILLPPPGELIIGILSFGLLLLVLYRVAFPQLKRTLEERTERIEGRLAHAERVRQEADELLERYRARLAAAEDEADRIIQEGRVRALEIRNDAEARAAAEADRMVERAGQIIASERDRALRDLKREVGTLALQLAGRVVGESLDGDRQMRLVDRFIDELDRGPVAATGAPGGEARRGPA